VRELLTSIASGEHPASTAVPVRRTPRPGSAVGPADAPGGAGWPATPVQEQLWVLDRLQDVGAGYNVSFVFHIDGPADPAAVVAGVRSTVARHDGLATAFGPSGPDGALVQRPVTLELVPAGAEQVDLATAERIVHEETRRPFALAAGPLVRARVLAVAPGDCRVVFVASHAVIDGWSVGVLVDDLAAAIGGREADQDPAPRWSAYARGLRHDRARREADEAVAAWRELLAGTESLVTGLAPEPGSRPSPGLAGGTLRFALPGAAEVDDAARRLEVSPFVLQLAAFQLAVARLAATRTVVTGVPLLNRGPEVPAGLVGPVSNTLPVRVDLPAEPDDVAGAVRATAAGLAAALAAQAAPVPHVVRDRARATGSAGTTLFSQLFNTGNLPGGGRPVTASPDVSVRPVAVPNGTSRIGLDLTLEPTGDGSAGGRLEFDQALHPAPRATRLVEELCRQLPRVLSAGLRAPAA